MLYCFLFFCKCPQNFKRKKNFHYFLYIFLLLQQLEIRSCWINKDTHIMIGKTLMHLRASLFEHHHSLHHITFVFVPFLFFSDFVSSLGTRGLRSF